MGAHRWFLSRAVENVLNSDSTTISLASPCMQKLFAAKPSDVKPGQTVIASPLVYPHAFKRPSIAFISQKNCKGDKLARHTPTGRGL